MRQCEECGTQMPPFQARITVQGRKVCGDCVGLMALAALENPIHDRTKKHPEEWFHGSPYGFEGFSDPAARHDQDEEEESGRFNHWNILVGNHFTSDHSVAHDFSEGLHHSEVHNDEPLKHVVHVKLHVQNPKVYKSEHDMDQDVYEWEHGENRNFHDSYEQPESDDWDEDDDRATQERRKYRGDSQTAYSKHDYEGSHPKATGWLNAHPDKEGIARRYKERMQRAGYDGVIYGNEYEHSRHGQAAKSAIAFEPHQIEITQHHYGHGGCLSDEEAKRRAVHPDQEMLPGTEYMDRKLPKKREVDVTKVWPKTWTPSYFHGDRTRHRESPIGHPDDQSGLNVWGALQRENTGRLSAPLPQECWDRYYGRHTGSQRRTAAHVMRYTTMGPQGYQDVEKEISGPLYHGGGARWREGAEIKPGRKTNEWGDEQGKSQHVYFTDKLDVAADYAQRTGGHVFEVEPTGDIKPDHHEGEYKTKHPLRVVRRLDPEEWQVSKQAAQQPYGEQSALHDAGQQDVYAVRDGNSMVMLCGHHADTHIKNRSAADALGDQVGLSPRERSAEMLGQARKGRCAACGRDTAYQLKLLTPRWVQNAQDSRARRKPDKPLKTKPLPSLKQSENAKEPVYYYHGTITEPEEHPDPYANGSHQIQPEWRQSHFEVHPDENKAWHHAISKWKNEGDENDFPRVYRIYRGDLKDPEPTSGGGLRVKHPVAGSEMEYHSDEHPPIQLDDEKGPILYHGTTHEHRNDDLDGDYTPLTHISPGTEAGKAPTHGGGVSDPSYAYATKDPHVAWHYADHRAKYGPGGIPHVYRVTPHKPEDVEEDPSHTADGFLRGNFSGDMRSKSGFKVLDEVPMPRRVQQDYEPSSDHDEDDDDWGESHYGVRVATRRRRDDRAPVPGQLDMFSDDELGIRPGKSDETKPSGPLPNRYNFLKRPAERDHWYHGGSHDLDLSRRTGQIGDTTHWNTALGPHFAGNEKLAGDFASGDTGKETGRITHAKLHISNPKVYKHEYDMDQEVFKDEMARGTIEDTEDNRRWSRVRSPKPMAIMSRHPDVTGIAQRFKEKLKSQGYDGIVYKNAIETGQGMCAVPFDHDQVEIMQHHDYDPKKKRKSAGNPYQCDRSERTAMAMLPTLRMLAHDATEDQAIRHCPFCGGGKIIGRADGSVECEFCHSYFTVQVQPQYPNFPQTIDGVPQNIPGMPGQVETPQMDAGGLPPGEEGGDTGDAPPWAEDGEQAPTDGPSDETDEGAEDASGQEPPPFAKKSFRTVTGALLDEDDYARHLAIRFAPDRSAMIARIREERGAWA